MLPLNPTIILKDCFISFSIKVWILQRKQIFSIFGFIEQEFSVCLTICHICMLAHIIILQIKKKEVRLSFHENWPENYKSSTLKWLLLQFSAVWHKNEVIWGHSYLVGWYALEPICLFKCRKLAIAGSFSYTDVVTEYRACTWDSVGHPILSNYFFTKNKLRQYFLF